MSWNDWVVLIVVPLFTALSGFAGAFYAARINAGTQKEMSREQIDTQKEINSQLIIAEVVAKSRVDWIREVRKLSAEFIVSYQKLYVINLKSFLKIKYTYDTKLEAREQLEQRASQLKLYFGNREDNQELIELIDEMFNHLTKESLKIKKEKEEGEPVPDSEIELYSNKKREMQVQFVNKMRVYLNQQWVNAKKLEIGNTSDVPSIE